MEVLLMNNDQSVGGTNQSVRYSDPFDERGGWIGRGERGA